MTFRDLYETCISLIAETKVYIFIADKCVETTCKDVIGERGGEHIKWFCFRADGSLEVKFK